MQRQKANKKFAVTCIAILSATSAACLSAGWTMSQRPVPISDPELSPAEIVTLRFPDQLLEDAAPQGELVAIEDTTTTDADETLTLFNPFPTYPRPSAQPEAPPVASTIASVPASVQLASLPQPAPAPIAASQAQLATAANKLASAAARRSSNTRPGAVLSDGQIASIKQRLKLTPDQQQMWPAVEVALRNLSYDKKSGSQGSQSRLATIDSGSTEVKHLTSAAFPLIMSFSDDQKHELHVLAHVAGLEQLVPKF
jgi:hypothetical protein